MVATIAATGVAGFGLERVAPATAPRVARAVLGLLLWVLVPFIAFFTLARLELTAGLGVGVLLGYAERLLTGLAAFVVATRVLRLDRPTTGALVVVAILANSGYLGVPLNAVLLGRDAVAPAIAYDTAVSTPMFLVAGFAVGAAFGTVGAQAGASRVRTFLARNPPLLALVAGLLAPDALAPDALVDAAVALATYAVLPLGFFALGLTLAAEPVTARLDPPVVAAIALRLVVAPAVYLALTAAVAGVPDAYRLQAAMPSAIAALIVAHATGLDVRPTAAAVAWTTAVVVSVAAVAAVAAAL